MTSGENIDAVFDAIQSSIVQHTDKLQEIGMVAN